MPDNLKTGVDRRFTSLEHMQAEALLWARNVTGQRQCRPLDGAKPLPV